MRHVIGAPSSRRSRGRRCRSSPTARSGMRRHSTEPSKTDPIRDDLMRGPRVSGTEYRKSARQRPASRARCVCAREGACLHVA